jgi:nucleoside-diphosphate-sugar epimerase
MRIIVTGATGAIGRATVPRLVAAGHDVVGLHQHDHGAAWLRSHGAEAVRVDLFDAAKVGDVLRGADAAVHLATSIPPLAKMTKARHWVMNDRLRSDATRILADAAERVGVGQLIIESITFNYVDRGDHWISEDDAVAAVFRPTASALVAEHHMTRFAAAGGVGVSLRFAQLYGPGTVSADLVEALRSRKVPLVGTGTNYVSSIHTDDAGTAVVAALAAPSGIYNIADDQPMRARDRLELQAGIVDAPTPRRISTGLAKLLAGKAVHQLTVSQRVLNRRYRDTTGWAPTYPSIRDGWPTVLHPESQERSAR